MFPKQWRKTVRVKDIIAFAKRASDGDYPDGKTAVSASKKIVSRLRESLSSEVAGDACLSSIVAEFDNVGADSDGDPVVELDRALHRLYLWSDVERVSIT